MRHSVPLYMIVDSLMPCHMVYSLAPLSSIKLAIELISEVDTSVGEKTTYML